MRGRTKLAYLGVLTVVTTVILSHPGVVMAQMPNADPELHIVEPIITEETMPNEPGDWDLRVSGSYSWRGAEGFGFVPRTQLFFGIANRWGGEVELPLAFAFGYSAGHRVQETDADNQIVITGLSHFPLRPQDMDCVGDQQHTR